MNYEEDIKIDDQLLDVEWLEQPEKMFKYCRIAAETSMYADNAKEKYEVARAELDMNIRKDPGSFGLEKVTDKAIDAIITTDVVCKKVYGEFIQAKYEQEMAKAAVRAFEQRKDALENLVKLHGQSYFAGPKVPHDLNQVRAKKYAPPIIMRRTS